MANLKQQALDKMLKEMEQEHSPSEDRIHNWLCEQEDDELFQGVLKEGYTIKAALKYVSNKAREFAQNGMACILDETVFEWVREYFLSNSKVENIRQVPVEPVKKEKPKKQEKIEKATASKPAKPEKGVVENQMSIFDFLDKA
ncbi:TPA: hypothetical protein U1137_000520 [Streptococcus suis]|nr:hypothetical protein [Streptococcus suis]HEM4742230.1 hypothetical protein [Streptococcus suis]HEM4756937.1 hypothetical protein [Streptococcus suis]HEM4784592.1 hypothetical protein [Streptococcus suis]HEM4789063.1 hypothetical protein [Streptococcus suis]